MSTPATPLAGQPTPELSPTGAGSNALQSHRELQAEWARVWHSLPASAKNGFQRLAAQTTPLRASGKPRLGAFFLFANLSTALVQAGKEPVLTPANAPVYPATLPKQMTLLPAVNAGRFSLQIQCSPYANAVALYGAAPVMAQTALHETAFRYIGSVPSIPQGGFDAAVLYAAAFGVPQAGEKIALKLQGVSSAGYVTIKQFVAGITTAAAAAGELADDTPEAALKLA